MLGQDERRLQGEFVEHLAPDAVSHREGEVDECRARQHGAPAGGVVGQPRVDGGRQPAGEQQTFGVGEMNGRSEQGCSAGARPASDGSPPGPGASSQYRCRWKG
ncbi:hypothetical protein LUX57_51500 [Actinomadura madurae]|nr:hypothetical protein [Actinomadura madurae]MCP9972488.1 hypothetical protein [Actinomadura madurae]